MAKFLVDTILNRGLEMFQATGTIVSLCLSAPADNAGALGTASLGTLGAVSGNYTIADDTSGRKITYGPGTIVVGTTGTITHVAWCGSGTLLALGTCAPTAVTAAGTVVVNAVDIFNFADIA